MQGSTESTPLDALAALPWIDMVGLGLAGLFLFLGIWRGLWWQVIRLGGVVASVALARGLSPRFSPTVESTFEFTPEMSHGIAWLSLFLGGLVITSLFGIIGKRALNAMQLGLVDRVGGALAGVLTGAVLHSAFLVALTGFATQEWATETLAGTRSAYLLDTLSRKAHVLMDAQAAERLLPYLGTTGAAETDPEAPAGE
ncbi:MAG: putative membrane protein required for colicin V production [Chlamydiales bacterium]|jgi:uncharacterized membrane protein required for colicin V production